MPRYTVQMIELRVFFEVVLCFNAAMAAPREDLLGLFDRRWPGTFFITRNVDTLSNTQKTHERLLTNIRNLITCTIYPA